MCEALIEEPDKTWSLSQLAQVSGCGMWTAERIVHRLWIQGAVDHVMGSQLLKAASGGQRIRDLMASGRPQSVIGMWVWEGHSDAVALWQAKRRANGWRRQNQAKPENISQRYRSDRITRITQRLTGLYWRCAQWFRSGTAR